jgi:phosphoribosylamine--glycine ligase
MKVLVVGSGAREHALCWKLRQSPLLSELYCAPGNPGIAELAELVPVAVDEVRELAGFARTMQLDLVVVGPELPLALGLADELTASGIRVFGPSSRAAELESSKVFTKEFLVRHGVPTAEFRVAHDSREVERAVSELGFPVVLKADGLAQGKGVLLVPNEEALTKACTTFFSERRFGVAGDRVVVERMLFGEEVSFLALSDGERLVPLATARDYKRLFDGDEGPNTGGMGAHSPSGLLSAASAKEILERILYPVVRGLADENRTFVGVLYAGLILTAEGPQVLEFNVRFGDPECQAILLRLEDDLLPWLAAGATGSFPSAVLRFRREASAVVVIASAGYPDRPVTGEPIEGLEEAAALPGVVLFHGGTALRDGKLMTAGGRVLSVGARGGSLIEALQSAYRACAKIEFPSRHYRTDIGRKTLERLQAGAEGLET